MAWSSEVHAMAKFITETHGGRIRFNFGEVAKIASIGRDNVAAELHRHGVLVQKSGREKMVNVFDLAEYMLSDRVAPIDNTSRVPRRTSDA